jgi:hypothetical protein
METGKPLPDGRVRTLAPEELAQQQAARDRIHEWFTKGQHLTKHQAKSTTLLLDASMVGHTEAARVLLEKGVRVLIERDFGPGRVKYTALHHAAAGGHTDVVCPCHGRVHEMKDSRVHEMKDVLNPEFFYLLALEPFHHLTLVTLPRTLNSTPFSPF